MSLPEYLKTLMMENCAQASWRRMWNTVFQNWLSLSLNVGERQEGKGRLLSFKTPQLGEFEDLEKKATYILCLKVRHFQSS